MRDVVNKRICRPETLFLAEENSISHTMMMCFFFSLSFSLCVVFGGRRRTGLPGDLTLHEFHVLLVSAGLLKERLLFFVCSCIHFSLIFFLRQRERNLVKRFFPVFSFILHLLLRKQFSFSLLLLGRIPRRG